jgi:hypothetical protein
MHSLKTVSKTDAIAVKTDEENSLENNKISTMQRKSHEFCKY